jgi:hypothetical protein
MANDRNAGRKNKFNIKDVEEMFAMLKKGSRIDEIADKFNTSRQVIGRYINKRPDKSFTHKITYMLGHKPMTIIYVDFLDKKIQIQNRTDNIYDRAFGKVINPNWKQFEIFINDRVIPKERIDLDKALKIIGVDHYDPFLIINKTKGRMEGDRYWMRIKKIA